MPEAPKEKNMRIPTDLFVALREAIRCSKRNLDDDGSWLPSDMLAINKAVRKLDEFQDRRVAG